MRDLPFKYASEPERKPSAFTPWLRIAIALAAVVICKTVLVH